MLVMPVTRQARPGLGSPWLSCEQGMEGALPVPSSPLPRAVPAPPFGGCLVPIPVLAGGEQRVWGGADVQPQLELAGLGPMDTTDPGRALGGCWGAGGGVLGTALSRGAVAAAPAHNFQG